MFVVAMKTTRTRLTVWGMAALALLAVVFASVRSQPTVVATLGGGDAGRVTLLQELGCQVPHQWSAVQEVVLPAEPDAEWTAYNEMQQACGYDLTPYWGERVKCYTYSVENRPGAKAKVYEYEGKVIAGDISAQGAEGFSQGLTPLSKEQGETHGATG